MANTSRERRAPPELAVAALVAAASLPLSRLFAGGSIGGTVVVALALSLTVSWGARRMNMSPALVWVVSVVAMLWFITIRFFPDTLFGVFPSGKTFGALGDAMRTGARQIYDEAVPVKTTPELLMFVTAGVWMTTWLVDTSAVMLGSPLLGAASAFPLFLLAGTLEPSRRLWIDAGGFIAASAWLLYDGERDRVSAWAARSARAGWRAWTAAWVAVLSIIAALVLAPQLPGFGAEPWLRSRGPGQRVTFNPFVAIKPTLDSKQERILFTVETSKPTYYRLTSVEVFDGHIFKPGFRTEIDPALWTPPPVTWESVRQRFQINALGGSWLPAAYRPTSIASLTNLKVESETDAFVVDDGVLQPGLTYQVMSDVPTPTAKTLDTPVVYDRDVLKPYLQLPKLPRALAQIAQREAGKEPTPFRQALALQNFFQTFTYDENVAARFAYGDIETFITKAKRGYCEQFAVSMTVLARALGIPARVALGFAPGSRVNRVYTVTTRDAHAWVEVYFPQAGWITFEPTPRAGVARRPDYTVPRSNTNPSGPTVSPSGSASAQPSAQPSRRPQPGEQDPGGSDATSSGGVSRWVVLGVVVGAGVTIPFVLAGIASMRRRRRIRRARDARERVGLTYADFLSWCAAAGLARGPGETPTQHAARAGSIATEAAEPLGRLAVAVDEALFAPPDGLDATDAERAAADARAAIAGGLGRTKRLLATIGFGRR